MANYVGHVQRIALCTEKPHVTSPMISFLVEGNTLDPDLGKLENGGRHSTC